MWLDLRRKIFQRRALAIRDAVKKYGKKKIVDNLNMTVPEGGIYALLGSSGCGKTTLLACAVGIKQLDSGTVEVFGYSPGTRESGIPGSRVGYMPQEISLFSEFSMREALYYFGRIYSMPVDKIESRMTFLYNFLKLPDDYNRLVRDLSGGQQRRVSFCVALLHEPELLILDEPTVGVDPLLRQTIWSYLKDLSSSKKATIVITTHFIEEANQATIIGLMRNGKLLTEDSPTNLKSQYGTDLEDIVLKLCLLDSKEEEEEDAKSVHLPGVDGKTVQDASDDKQFSKIKIPWNESSGPLAHLHALLLRNFIRMWRNIGYMAFLFLFPASGVLIICICIGGELDHLNFGVINQEIRGGICGPVPKGCILTNISCMFIKTIPEDALEWKPYETEEEALESVRKGDTWGYLFIPHNFSKNFPNSDDPESKNSTKLRIRMDLTNHQIALSLRKTFYESFQDFIKSWFDGCFIEDDFLDFPLIWDDPIFGDNDPDFKEYVAPSVHLCNILFMAVALTGEVFIIEKRQGMLERSLVAGVTRNEVIASHFLSQYVVLLIQAFFALMILLVAFQLPVRGSIFAVIGLTVLQGTMGILLGFLFSTICSAESTVIQLTIGMILPNFILSGVMWPLEGMPTFFKWICFFAPSTLSCEAIRSIMSRGWEITHPLVLVGFISNFIWIGCLILVISILNRYLIKTA